MRVAVVGQGYVGLTAALGLAAKKHQVIGVEADPRRLRLLTEGEVPFEERGFGALLAEARGAGTLAFAGALSALRDPLDAVLIAVGSPPTATGRPDLGQVRAALADVLALTTLPGLVVVKSTVPPGTSADWLAAPDAEPLRTRYVYSPEFLSQGRAAEDWNHPARIVAGLAEPGLLDQVRELYRGIDAPWVVTDPTTAETVKYAANAFLATKVSFVGDLITLCEGTGADIDDVLTGAGLDPRIGPAFLRAEAGYAGSCLPKDTLALRYWSRLAGHPLPVIEAVIAANRAQVLRPVRLVRDHLGPVPLAGDGAVVAVLGLRYQAWTDDLRDAPSMTIVPELRALAGTVRIWEPSVPAAEITGLFPGTQPAADLTEALDGAAAAVVLTDWPQVTAAEWATHGRRMAAPRLLVDTKNCLPPAAVAHTGIRYLSMGPRRSDGRSGSSAGPGDR
ncbi:UDP-glucose dehydrogenase family protein [Streptomyces sp. NPDC012794]|uniref:UDP-glucose dehydrogenase family protein n=1 Tax=Streptomyces sp. NPDC012794 TaxID=3364850 RepID=UPI00368E070E